MFYLLINVYDQCYIFTAYDLTKFIEIIQLCTIGLNDLAAIYVLEPYHIFFFKLGICFVISPNYILYITIVVAVHVSKQPLRY